MCAFVFSCCTQQATVGTFVFYSDTLQQNVNCKILKIFLTTRPILVVVSVPVLDQQLLEYVKKVRTKLLQKHSNNKNITWVSALQKETVADEKSEENWQSVWSWQKGYTESNNHALQQRGAEQSLRIHNFSLEADEVQRKGKKKKPRAVLQSTERDIQMDHS